MTYHALKLIVALFGLSLLALTAHGGSIVTSPYAGQEARVIKSLSAEDIDDLINGRGWGLAKPAELNGVPGPAHLLELQQEIALTPEQVSTIEALWTRMNQKARELGKRYVALEKELNTRFVSGHISAEMLKALLLEIGAVRAELRFVHLSAHLEAKPILKSDQVALYNRLRGYSNDDPCENIPKGHDPDMWKKHNHCE
jgi:hypothetical protein